ncbi:MAG: trypsin-like peptidase domain-containing protein [Lachnospiraceae bacterium]|nr:trypsin-like peptidase domain-containing protein [Lachnospiraceae bacterium]
MKKLLTIMLFAVISGISIFFVFKGIGFIRSDLERMGSVSSEPDLKSLKEMTYDDENESLPDQTRITGEESAKPYNVASEEDVSAIVDIVMPAVVSIDCEVPIEQYTIFGTPQTYITKSSGSGFLVSQSSSQLFICTNEHVIKDAAKVSVTFCDDTVADAMVVGYDTSYDLAIVSVSISRISDQTLKNIKIAAVGNSDSVMVGDINIAIGNSLGHGQSVTVGYISALGREINIDGTRTRPLIQTDAAINPGNSGGPLLDIYGKVIGINCAKYSGITVEGIGYAIPINNVVSTINELINSFSIEKGEAGRLGIEGKDVSEGYAKGFSMPRGVYVYGIEEGSKASESDLKVGDIITEINGQEILSFEYLGERVGHYRAGSTVTITVMRPSKNKYVKTEINVVLDTLE